jgi:NitT/TauT family transport system substrate-binding protein
MSSLRHLLLACLGLACGAAAQAQEKLVYLTNWYAQAEHGGFYQAVATGIYKKYGLDVTIKMGGPQVNTYQLLAAGQADCVMGSSDMQVMVQRNNGLPVSTVAAVFQKDPQVLISHEDVKGFEQMKDKSILIASSARQGYWLWLKKRFDLKDEQIRPYTFNIQPFLADPNAVQQGYLTSEPYAIQKAGVKTQTHLFADHGWTSYATTISCMDETIRGRAKAIESFVKASMEGWKSFLADPAPAIPLIKKDNPNMTDDQIAYSVAKLKEMGIVASGDARSGGIGIISEARARQNHAFLVENKLIDPAKVKPEDAYKLDWIKAARVLP